MVPHPQTRRNPPLVRLVNTDVTLSVRASTLVRVISPLAHAYRTSHRGRRACGGGGGGGNHCLIVTSVVKITNGPL